MLRKVLAKVSLGKKLWYCDALKKTCLFFNSQIIIRHCELSPVLIRSQRAGSLVCRKVSKLFQESKPKFCSRYYTIVIKADLNASSGHRKLLRVSSFHSYIKLSSVQSVRISSLCMKLDA